MSDLQDLDKIDRRILSLLQQDGRISNLKLAEEVQMSATAVLEHRQLGCSYWAWRHCGSEADFHRRDSFLPLT